MYLFNATTVCIFANVLSFENDKVCSKREIKVAELLMFYGVLNNGRFKDIKCIKISYFDSFEAKFLMFFF